MEPGLVSFDAAIAKEAVVLRDEPGNRSLGHRAMFAIGLAQIVVASCSSCLDELFVVFGNAEAARACLRATTS